MKRDEFVRWFNKDFWKAFARRTIPLSIPTTEDERLRLLNRVYEAIQSARYSPSIPEIELVSNKGYGVARTIPVFCIEDYCVYYFCIKELEDVLCSNRVGNTFGGWRLGGYIRVAERDEVQSDEPVYGRYSFNPFAWSQAFGEFNALLFSQLAQGRHSHVLQFDLTNFYDSVRLDILERWIREAAPPDKGWIIALLFYLLNQWNRRNTGLHPQAVGLPMDALADCSRLLANYYLQRYDRFAERICEQAGAVYFRYSDDQMILLNGDSDVEKLLLLLTRHLDRYGLRVNQKKTHVWTAASLTQHRLQHIQALLGTETDARTPERIKSFVEAYLQVPLWQLQASWNGGMPLLNRIIFSNLDSLPPALFEQICIRFLSDAYLLAASQRQLVQIAKLNSKRTAPIDFAAKLTTLSDQCVHNVFHYEVLAYAKTAKLASLVDSVSARIEALHQLTSNEEW